MGEVVLSDRVLAAIKAGPELFSPTHHDAIRYGKKRETAEEFAERIAFLVLSERVETPDFAEFGYEQVLLAESRLMLESYVIGGNPREGAKRLIREIGVFLKADKATNAAPQVLAKATSEMAGDVLENLPRSSMPAVAAFSSDKQEKELIADGRQIIHAMERDGYNGIIWVKVLDALEARLSFDKKQEELMELAGFCWLIEKKNALGQPFYWTGRNSDDLTDDPYSALRFHSKEAAERIYMMCVPFPCHIVEHHFALSATRETIIEQCITALDTHGLASIVTPDKALTVRQVLRSLYVNSKETK